MVEVKNDIKILFYIVNSLNGLFPGLLAFSFGVAFGVGYGLRFDPTPSIGYSVGGLLTLAVAALGYAGAIRQNKIMLYIYAGLMALVVVGNIIVGAAMIDPRYTEALVAIITHLGFTVLALILAVILAVEDRKQSNQGMILSPPPAAYTPVA